jgi:RNA polymerase sigma-70 factor (ECF subfamily)
MSASPPASATSALELLYRKYYGLVRWVLRAVGVADPALDDQVHDVFLAIHRRLEARDPSVPMRQWVVGVARNVAFSHRRSLAREQQRAARLDATDEPPRPDEILATREAWRALSTFLDLLSPEQREVFVMVDVTGMRVSELAETTGEPANTLHSRLRVARDRFGQHFPATPTDESPAQRLRRARSQGGADAGERRRTWGLIVGAVGGPEKLAPVSALATTGTKAAWWTLAPSKIAAVFVTLGSVGAVAWMANGPTTAPTGDASRTVASPPPPSDRPPGRGAVADASAAPTDVQRLAPGDGPPTVDAAEPLRMEPRSPPRATPRPPEDPRPETNATDLAEALAVLERARDHLAKQHPRDALRALDGFDTGFGPLEREHRRVELDAACRLGDRPRARRAAQALVRLGAAGDAEHPCKEFASPSESDAQSTSGDPARAVQK